MSIVAKDSETSNISSQSVKLAGHSAAYDNNGSGELDGATFITVGLRDDPDEPLEGCGAADRACVSLLACE